MSTEKTSSTDLVLRKLGGSSGNSVIPVSTASLKLTETVDPANPATKFECFVCRDENGAVVQRLAGNVCVNGQPIQNHRLQPSDRIMLGNCMYEVTQLGKYHVERHTADADQAAAGQAALRRDNQSGAELEPADISNRFKKIEHELERQTENFSDINERFDSLGQQMSTLISVISGSAPSQQESTPDQVELAPSQLQTSPIVEAPTPANTAGSNCSEESTCCAEPTCSSELVGANHVGDPPDVSPADSPLVPLVTDGDNTDQEVVSDLAVEPGEPRVAPGNDDVFKERRTQVADSLVDSQPPELENVSGQEPVVKEDSQPADDDDNEKRDLLSRLNALTAANDHESTDEEPTQARPVDQLDNEQPGFIDADAIDGSASTGSVLKSNLQDDADGTLERLLSSLTSTGSSQDSSDSSTDDSVSGLAAVVESCDKKKMTECVEPVAEASVQEPSELENQSATTPAETDSSQLESLFASLREKDQRTVEDVNQAEPETFGEPDPAQPEPAGRDNLASFDNQLSETDTAGQMERLDSVLNSLTTQTHSESAATEPAPVAASVNTQIQEDKQQESVADVLARLQAMQGTQESSIDNGAEQPDQESAMVDSTRSPMPTVMLSEEQLPTAAVAVLPEPELESVGTELSVPEMDVDHAMSPQLEETSQPTEMPRPPVEEPLPAAVMSPEKQGGENVDDVQNYMNSLLQRLNGQKDVAAPVQPQPKPVPVVPETQPVPSQSAEVVSDGVDNKVESLEPAEFVPKRVAPERNSNLAAMRERANAYSRSALIASKLKRKKDMANSLLIGAAGSVVGAVTTSALSEATGDIFFCLSIVLFLVTAVCSGIYVRDNLFVAKAVLAESTNQSESSGVSGLKDKLMSKLSRDPEVEA